MNLYSILTSSYPGNPSFCLLFGYPRPPIADVILKCSPIANITQRYCLGQTWYLMCDMQLFFISPLVIFPMHYFERTRLLGNHTGLKIWLAVMALFTFVPMTLTVINGMPPGHGISIM